MIDQLIQNHLLVRDLTKLKASYDDIVVRDGSSQNMELKPGDQIVVPSETMVVLPTC